MAEAEVKVGEIIEEQVADQRIVPFMGDALVAALTTPGDIYISLPGMCAALGLHTQGQLQRIQRTSELVEGLRRISLNTRGGRQKTNCLRLDKLGLWLAGVETNSIKGPFQAKMVAYHHELAPAATRLFLRVAGVQTRDLVPPGDPQMTDLAAQIDHLTAVVGFLQEHLTDMQAAAGAVQGIAVRLDQAVSVLESLTEGQQHLTARQDATEDHLAVIDERTQGLSPAHKRTVQATVNHMVKLTKPGPHPLDYSRIYGSLKGRFHVAAYGEIADDQFADVMAHLQRELQRALEGTAPEQPPLF